MEQTLNPKQQEAVEIVSGPVVVIAGAGSGKTKVLTSRIAYLISIGIPSENILAITFTNKAAQEMRTRVERIVPTANSWISTFHSMCVKILRKHAHHIGYDLSFQVIDDDDQQSIVKKIMKDHNIQSALKPRAIISMMNHMKYGETYDLPNMVQEQLDFIYTSYVNYLKREQLMDFEDLLLNTVKLLSEHDQVLKLYQEQFQYILVDEYQDTNDIQNKLIMMLGKLHQNIFLVGDEDQSIYKFRGANASNLLNFENTFQDTKVIKLEQNYRSTQMILNAANALIAHNKSKHKKNLWTENDEGTQITYFRGVTDGDEVLYIAEEINTLLLKGEKPSEIGVLYRSNFLSRKVEEALRFLNIPYIIYGGVGYFKRKEVKDLLSYLRLIVNPEDNWSFMRVINSPKRGIGPATIEKLAGYAATDGISLFDVASNAEKYVSKTLMTKLIQFTDMITKLRTSIEEMPLTEFFDQVIEQSGYQAAMLLDGDDGVFRLENMNELKSVLSNYQLHDLTNEEQLKLILDDLSLHADYEADEQNSVKLMTMHNAKGLEFDFVFLYAMEEGIFPNSRSMDTEEDIKEERRLGYVGITRAKKHLYMTNASIRNVFGQSNANPPSRFIKEVGDEYIETKGVHKEQLKPIYTKKHEKIVYEHQDYKYGEKIKHKVFGLGTVISFKEDKVTIAFPAPHGIKDLVAGHPSMEKVE